MLPLLSRSTILRSFLKRSLFLAFFPVCTACSTASTSGGSFYSFVDGQGNVVTVAKSEDGNEGGAVDNDDQGSQSTTAEPILAQTGAATDTEANANAAPSPSALGIDAASNPDELWSMGDESYISSDEFEREVERKDRDRFVTYPDETGRLVTHGVDVVAARQAAEEKQNLKPSLNEQNLPAVSVVTRWSSIEADCCLALLDQAVLLSEGDSKPVNVMARPRGEIRLDAQRPAKAYRLEPDTKVIQLQSWNRKGFLYPQALFLDESGAPLARVTQIFTRYKGQTWAAQPYIVGEISAEPGAKWVVFFLDYVTMLPDGSARQDASLLVFEDEELPLALTGELVVRTTSGTF